ncbi:30408_t:CDS:1, partial [Gigaspora margarita]
LQSLQSSRQSNIKDLFSQKQRKPLSKNENENIIQKLIIFIIEDCQPLHILTSQAFGDLLQALNFNFQLPSKTIINEKIDFAYQYSQQQLQSIFENNINFV